MATIFMGVREYGPGDELRRVHWRTTARTGKLAVTEYTQGVTLDVTLALDLCESAYKGTGTDDHSALETAVTLTATLLADLLQHGHAVRLVTAGEIGGPAARSADDLPLFLERLGAGAGRLPAAAGRGAGGRKSERPASSDSCGNHAGLAQSPACRKRCKMHWATPAGSSL